MADLTRNEDQTTFGRTRGRMYFNVLASDDLRAVFGFELDCVWGASTDGAAGSCDRNTDVAGNIETKWLYVDFRIPQVPIGNRTRLGAMPLHVTPLHGALVMHGDSAGGDTLLTVNDQVARASVLHAIRRGLRSRQDRFPGQPQVRGGFRHRHDAAAEAHRGAGSASALRLWLYGELPSPA